MPGLTALRAFSVLAETGSVVRAGQALNVSHAAISQQIKALETHMAIDLVDRSRRGLMLTDQGVQLAWALSRGFELIANEIQFMANSNMDRPLQITTTPRFALNWLMPRLDLFQTKHPEINLMINPAWELSNPATGRIDLALRFGNGAWPGLEAERLFTSNMAVAAAPSLIGDKDIQSPRELSDLPWLQELGAEKPTDWFLIQDIDTQNLHMIVVPSKSLLDAARRGQGVVLTDYSNIEKEIADGTLKLLYRDDDTIGYYIVTHGDAQRSEVQTFINWLRAEGQKSGY